ncbi:hypothetical protein BS47DRAFT_571820 [Hydnum rufescens UP504]|uniref:Uncharacterized protein n=1 Tax=Hydnum rufescens UP504 TaxID=1448309 RepID=A0A9P6B6E5_9AGAM|nr:hypothetical protein BS47DRAFT_571820 [Hydnum rufescens UP504]
MGQYLACFGLNDPSTITSGPASLFSMSATISTSFESSNFFSGRDFIPVHYYSPPRLEKTQGKWISGLEDRTWRADLRMLILKDLAKGALGTRQHRIDGPILSYTLTYQIRMPDDALYRFARDPTGALDDPDTPTLFQIFECTKIWVSCPQTSSVVSHSNHQMTEELATFPGSHAEAEVACAIIHQANSDSSENRKAVTFHLPSAHPTPRLSSNYLAFNTYHKATPYPRAEELQGIVRQAPRELKDDTLSRFLRVFHRAFKQGNMPCIRHADAHPIPSGPRERLVHVGRSDWWRVSRVHAHIHHHILLVL